MSKEGSVEKKNTGNKQMIITILICFFGCALMMGAGFYYMANALKVPAAATSEGGATNADNLPTAIAADPIYVNLKPFTVNVKTASGRNQLLYTGLAFRVENEETAKFLNLHMPELRSRMMTAISEEDPDKAVTKEGKELLVKKLIATSLEPITTPQPELKIADVLFNEFIVQ